MIRTAGCKNTVSVHRRLSTLYRLRGQAQMQSGAWAEAEISLSRALHHERLHVKEEDLSINIDRGACLIATGRLIEAQDLLLHVAATASKVIDAPQSTRSRRSGAAMSVRSGPRKWAPPIVELRISFSCVHFLCGLCKMRLRF